MKLYQHTQGKDGSGLEMSKHAHWHAALTDVEDCAGESFSGMMGLIDFFLEEATGADSLKALTKTDITMVLSYTREAYLVVSFLLI